MHASGDLLPPGLTSQGSIASQNSTTSYQPTVNHVSQMSSSNHNKVEAVLELLQNFLLGWPPATGHFQEESLSKESPDV